MIQPLVEGLRATRRASSRQFEDCMGADAGGCCDGEVKLVQRTARSFGQPFSTHAWLCESHAEQLGYLRVAVA